MGIPRVKSQTSRLPVCFGDPKYHDPRDQECRDCGVRHRCSIRVSNSERLPNISSRSKTKSSSKKVEEEALASGWVGRDDAEFRVAKTKGGPFGRVFRHNLTLRGLSLLSREFAYGVEQIPLLPYGDEEVDEPESK